MTTHEVVNQPLPLEPYNAWASDGCLREAVAAEGAAAFAEQLDSYGAIAGDELARLGIEANTHVPVLRTHDRYGRRVDQVDFHPSYHRLMAVGIEHGLAGLTWSGPPGARVARSALLYLHNQFEAGTMCPITMTHAAVPALREEPALAAEWAPRLLSRHYDARFCPAEHKSGATLGMAMTEKQGGSDVRANTTHARAINDGAWELVGHKWFCSAPMSDAFLSLAQTEQGLSCFLVPRFRPDGSLNPIHIQRLKNKLGNRSNASAEIEYPGTWARLVGAPGRGIATILRMVAETRLDCAIGSAALMRQAVVQAIHHCDQRRAFGVRLVEQPLMRPVLAELAMESEAAMRLALHLAGHFERAASDESSELISRIATPIAKYWICKRAVAVVNEAQECLGGAGYIEDFSLPRLYREAPVNAIWEGSGNIQCLDVLRAVQREPRCLEALFALFEPHRGSIPGLDRGLRETRNELADAAQAPARARRLVERLAIALQALLLVESNSHAAAEAWVAARLTGRSGWLAGALPDGVACDAIIDRSRAGS